MFTKSITRNEPLLTIAQIVNTVFSNYENNSPIQAKLLQTADRTATSDDHRRLNIHAHYCRTHFVARVTPSSKQIEST